MLAAAHLRVPGAHSRGQVCEPRQSLSRALGLENNYAARPTLFICSGLGLCIISKKSNVPSETSISSAEYSRERAVLNRREAAQEAAQLRGAGRDSWPPPGKL